MDEELKTKLLEIDPEKDYILVVKRGTIEPSDLTLPGLPRKRIMVIYVNDINDVRLDEKQQDQ